ncbi:hypothetical protein D3C81_1601320 [compost metagenome]
MGASTARRSHLPFTWRSSVRRFLTLSRVVTRMADLVAVTLSSDDVAVGAYSTSKSCLPCMKALRSVASKEPCR